MNKSELLKEIREIVREALNTPHFDGRLKLRILNTKDVPVGYKNGTEFICIGTYIIPEIIKTNTISDIKMIENYKFPQSKSYAIQIAQIPIDRNQINYTSEQLKLESKVKPLVLKVGETEDDKGSVGNVIYIIVRNNKIDTVMLYLNGQKIISPESHIDVVTSMKAIKEKKIYEEF